MVASNHSVRQNSKVEFVIVLLASTFLMGSSFIAGKILLHDGFPALLLVGWRFFLAALATLPLVLFDGRLRESLLPSGLGLREVALTVLIGLLQTAAVMGLLFLAMNSISASTAAILLFTNPIWVALLGRFFLGEKLSTSRLAGLLLGLVGVGFAIGVGPELFSGSNAIAGELIAVGSSLCWAAATLINKRARLPFGPWALSFWQMFIGSCALLAVAYGMGQRWPAAATITQWAWFLWLAIPASTGSFGLWFVALEKGGATTASSFLFLAPLFTVVLSFFILDASLSWQQAIGGTLIGFALWLVNRNAPARNRREERAAASAEGRP
jgi:drug/metabolite transporter (DMT)-like permease